MIGIAFKFLTQTDDVPRIMFELKMFKAPLRVFSEYCDAERTPSYSLHVLLMPNNFFSSGLLVSGFCYRISELNFSKVFIPVARKQLFPFKQFSLFSVSNFERKS